MIKYTKGDVLEAPAFGHGCNCRGIMGAGIARKVRLRFPKAYSEYKSRCEIGLALGDVVTVEDGGKWIFNMATQRDIGPCAEVWAIRAALGAALLECGVLGIPELAIPWIGCGIGGLSMHDVRPAIDSKYDDMSRYLAGQEMRVDLVVYEWWKPA